MRGPALALLLLCACGGDDSRPATIAYLVPAIFRPSCTAAGCHDETTAAGRLVLDADPETVRDTLVDKGLVNVGRPAISPLMNVLTGDYPGRMPPDAPLPEVDIQLIGRWITEGLK